MVVGVAVDAYGTLAFGTPTSPFGYSGQYTDATSGLVNDRDRNYQPQTGGFTTRDPAFATTDTAYTYAGGDPVNGSDPLGLCNANPFSGSFWSSDNCVVDVVGGPKSSPAKAITNLTFGIANGGAQLINNLPSEACGIFPGASLDPACGWAQQQWSSVVNLTVPEPFQDPCNSGLNNLYNGEWAFGTAWGEVFPFVFGGEAAGGLFGQSGAAEGTSASAMPQIVGEGSPTLDVNGERFYYGQRVLNRAIDEPGPYHNFPQSFDATIIENGAQTVYPNGYVEYTLQGSIGGEAGTYQIGTVPAPLSQGGQIITHRFFEPGG
jgi:RHS repeat-associated protein